MRKIALVAIAAAIGLAGFCVPGIASALVPQDKGDDIRDRDRPGGVTLDQANQQQNSLANQKQLMEFQVNNNQRVGNATTAERKAGP